MNLLNENGETILFYACRKTAQDEELVKLLLEKGVDAKIKNKNGKEAIEYLFEQDTINGKVAALLVDKVCFAPFFFEKIM